MGNEGSKSSSRSETKKKESLRTELKDKLHLHSQRCETKSEALNRQQEVAATDSPGLQGDVDLSANPSNSANEGELTELEQILKQKTYTRSEIDRLTSILHLKSVDLSLEDKVKETAAASNSFGYPYKNSVFQMSVNEDCMELDDASYPNGAASDSLAEERGKANSLLAGTKRRTTEAFTLEKPSKAFTSDMEQKISAPIFKSGDKTASTEDTNAASTIFNFGSKSVEKFTSSHFAFASPPVLSEHMSAKFDASSDTKPETSSRASPVANADQESSNTEGNISPSKTPLTADREKQNEKNKRKSDGDFSEGNQNDGRLYAFQVSSDSQPVQPRFSSHSGNPLGSFCSVKLNHENYLLWKNLVLPVIRGNRLEGFITGAEQCPPEYVVSQTETTSEGEVIENPEYEGWVVQDQILLGWLYNSIEPDVAVEVMGFETSKGLWDAIRDLFGVKNQSNVVFFKREFQKMQKGDLKMNEYLKEMKKLADNLALAGHPVSMHDFVSQILAGLDSSDYNPVVCQISEKDSISWIELQAKLLSYEKRLEQINAGIVSIKLGQVSANFATSKGATNSSSYHNKNSANSQGNYNKNQGYSSYHNQGRAPNAYRNRSGGRSRGRGGRGNSLRPICQICGKIGHTKAVCYYRPDKAYMGAPTDYNKPNQNPSSLYLATPETLSDPAWYADSGASCYVTDDAGNFAQIAEYHGQGNGNGGTSRQA